MKDTVSTILPCCVAIFSAMPVCRLGWRRAETRAGQDISPTRSTLCSQQFIDAENASNDVQADERYSLHYLTMLCGDIFMLVMMYRLMKDIVSTILPCCVAIFLAMPVCPSLGWRRAETNAGQDTSPTRSTLCSQQFIDAENAKRCNDVQADDYADSIADCTRSQNSVYIVSM